MATSSHWYGPALESLLAGGLKLDGSSTLTAMLLSSAYTPSEDHTHVSDVAAAELSGNGYARVNLTGVAASYAAGGTASFTADPVQFATMTGTFRYMVLFASAGSDATSQLIKWTDFGADQSVTNGTVTSTPAASGLASITAS